LECAGVLVGPALGKGLHGYLGKDGPYVSFAEDQDAPAAARSRSTVPTRSATSIENRFQPWLSKVLAGAVVVSEISLEDR
jgi:hypothetical protein